MLSSAFGPSGQAESSAAVSGGEHGGQVEGKDRGAGEARPSEPPLDGRAYCFLPLPIRTLLPLHINGYFELSSNRRDIWYGGPQMHPGLV